MFDILLCINKLTEKQSFEIDMVLYFAYVILLQYIVKLILVWPT